MEATATRTTRKGTVRELVRLLYCFVVMSPDRRRVMQFHVTANPSAAWTAQRRSHTPHGAENCALCAEFDGSAPSLALVWSSLSASAVSRSILSRFSGSSF
jgi:hypothetical protein